MSLSTRIAIGPSRRLALVEAAIVAGAIIVTAATAAARFVDASAPAATWLTVGAAALIAVLVAIRRCIDRLASASHEVFLDERAGVSVRRLGDEDMPHAVRLNEDAVVWPDFAVLSLASTSAPVVATALRAPLRRRALEIPVLRTELDPHDARRLYRFLRWAERGGSYASGRSGKAFLG